MSFARYPDYKDSGVEWLGEVPGHWKVVQFKQFVDIQNGSDHKHVEQDQGYPVLGSGGVFTYASDFLYDGESVLLGRKGTIDKPLHINGRFWTVDTMYWTKISPAVSGRFAYYLAVTIPFDFYSTNTALPSMTKGALSSHRVAHPPLPEQTQIAAFLDRETAKIDGLVAEQRRLMALLKEKRQAVISHAVTQGLNPHAPMKPSGIEWLGDVPAHWEVRKLCNLARLESGHTPSRQRADYWIEEDCVIPWFTLADVGFLRDDRNIFIESTTQRISQVGIENSSARLLPPETVLLSRTASVGFSGITKISLAVSQDFAAWICSARIHPRYLLSSLRAMKPEFHRLMMGSTHQTIYMPDIEAFRVPVPPIIEQLAIVDFIEGETFKLDTLTLEAQRAIDLLQERRTALISAAVTGQIDVRGVLQ